MSGLRPAHLAGGAAVIAAVAALFLLAADDGVGPVGEGPEASLGAAADGSVEVDAVDVSDAGDDGPLLSTEVDEPTPAETAGPAPASGGVELDVWYGKVRTPEGGPVAGADVHWLDPTRDNAGGFLLKTNHEGLFLLDGAPPGPLLRVAAQGYADQVVPVGETGREVTIVMLPRRTVVGDVVAAEDGRPLPDARVEAESASWRGEARTDATGRFQLEPPEGEGLILFVSYPQRVSRVHEEADGMTIPLERGRRVEGVVAGPTGQPFPAEVYVYGASALTRPQRATCDARGEFAVEGLDPADEVAVLAFAAGHATPWELAWQPPIDERLVVTLVPTASLTLTGAPAGVLTLRAVDAPLGTGRARAEPESGVDPLGGLEAEQRIWTGLAPGSYQLELDGRARGPVVPVAAGQAAQLSWRDEVQSLEADVDDPDREGPLRVQVLVLDAAGAGVEDAVVLAAFGETQRSGRTDERGELVFERLPERPLTFSASQPGRVLLRPEFVDPAQGLGDHVVLILARPVNLEGQVVPAVRASLRLSLADPEELLFESETDADGRFDLTGLAPASYRLEVAADHHVPVDMQVSLPLSGPLRIELEASEHRHGPDDDHDH